jgi:hypothetical protein
MHDSSRCPICSTHPTGVGLSDEAFAAFLDLCRGELVPKQERFQQRIRGSKRWTYEMTDGSLTIGDTRFGMVPIGTYSTEYQSWFWAWANEDFPAVAREAAARIRGLYETTGFRVFDQPGIDGSSEDAQDFVALAVHQLEASAMFRCPSDGGPILYLAVFEPHESGEK